MKRPQTKFHANTMIHFEVIRSKKSKFIIRSKFIVRLKFLAAEFFLVFDILLKLHSFNCNSDILMSLLRIMT